MPHLMVVAHVQMTGRRPQIREVIGGIGNCASDIEARYTFPYLLF